MSFTASHIYCYCLLLSYSYFVTSRYQSPETSFITFRNETLNYQLVYNDIAKVLPSSHYDDGSYAPIITRLALHSSVTYDKVTDTGGSNGATMRFCPEKNYVANRGMENARNRLDPIYQKYKHLGLSYSDLWTLGGVCAIQESAGPKVFWRAGRIDGQPKDTPPDGRFPNPNFGQDHLRAVFSRMNFGDQEIVALSGGHTFGKCHYARSGFEGHWTFTPLNFTNAYYKVLWEEHWELKPWNGLPQYEDLRTKSLIMLNTDMSLIRDEKFRYWVKSYSENEDKFFEDFSSAFAKLLELGVPISNFKKRDPVKFKTVAEQNIKRCPINQ